MAELLRNGCELMLAQVFTTSAITSCTVVAAAIDWAVAARAQLIHMSLGLAADREVLCAAVKRALAAGCIVVAATPARGSMTYPAAYAGVIQGTGDARCGPGELAYLGPRLFGGCATFIDPMTEMRRGGASFGAAGLTAAIIRNGPQPSVAATVSSLASVANYRGREARSKC